MLFIANIYIVKSLIRSMVSISEEKRAAERKRFAREQSEYSTVRAKILREANKKKIRSADIEELRRAKAAPKQSTNLIRVTKTETVPVSSAPTTSQVSRNTLVQEPTTTISSQPTVTATELARETIRREGETVNLGALLSEYSRQQRAKLDADKDAGSAEKLIRGIGTFFGEFIGDVASGAQELVTPSGRTPQENFARFREGAKEFFETGDVGLAGVGPAIRAKEEDPREGPVILATVIVPEVAVGKFARVFKTQALKAELRASHATPSQFLTPKVKRATVVTTKGEQTTAQIAIITEGRATPVIVNDEVVGFQAQFPEAPKTPSPPKATKFSTKDLLQKQTGLGDFGIQRNLKSDYVRVRPSLKPGVKIEAVDDVFPTIQRDVVSGKQETLPLEFGPKKAEVPVQTTPKPARQGVFSSKKGQVAPPKLEQFRPEFDIGQEFGRLARPSLKKTFTSPQRTRPKVTAPFRARVPISTTTQKTFDPFQTSKLVQQPVIKTIVFTEQKPVLELVKEEELITDPVQEGELAKELIQEGELATKAKTRTKTRQALATVPPVLSDPVKISVPRGTRTSVKQKKTTKKKKAPSRLPLPSFDKKVGVKPVEGYYAEAKSKGRWVRINKKPLSKQNALSQMSRVVDNTVSRSGRIIKSNTKIKPKKKDNYFSDNIRDYTINRKGNYVELPRAAIDTRGEREGITVKGWLAKRNKKNKRKK